jgi:hypothetical protein
MNLADIPTLVEALIGFLLTLMVFSYLIKDNFLFRLAIHIFIGVSAGYATVAVCYNILWLRLLQPFIQSPLNQIYLAFPPLLLGIWLLSKASPSLSRIGGPVAAFMVGIGAATALVGAVSGTLFPQIWSSVNMFDLQAARQRGDNLAFWLVNALVVLVGTLTTLAYFHFGTRSKPDATSQRQPWIEFLGQIGQVFLVITFGGLFAGVYAAALTALIERLGFILEFIRSVVGSIL